MFGFEWSFGYYELHEPRLYACQLYAVVYSMLVVTGSQSKNVCFCLDMAQWRSPIGQSCAMASLGQTWVLASIGAVVEMGILSTLKRLLMESNPNEE
jgi:hypothetical protein